MNRIRDERKRLGWTQTELGYKAKLATTEISRFETGRAKPYPSQLARIARALKVPADHLLDERGDDPAA